MSKSGASSGNDPLSDLRLHDTTQSMQLRSSGPSVGQSDMCGRIGRMYAVSKLHHGIDGCTVHTVLMKRSMYIISMASKHPRDTSLFSKSPSYHLLVCLPSDCRYLLQYNISSKAYINFSALYVSQIVYILHYWQEYMDLMHIIVARPAPVAARSHMLVCIYQSEENVRDSYL